MAVMPLTVYGAPGPDTPVIVTVEPPVLVTVTLDEVDCPAATSPKVTLVGLELNIGVAVVPKPPSEIVKDGFDALLAIWILPAALPPIVGANATVKEILPPAFTVAGPFKPLRLNPAPEAVAWEIFTLALPAFDRVTVCEVLPLTATLPNAIVPGLAASCPCVPAPVNDTETGEFVASLVIDKLPLAAPADFGANWIFTVAVSPAATLIGSARPGALKLLFEKVAWVTFTAAEPELFSVIVWFDEEPTATFPKPRLGGAERSP